MAHTEPPNSTPTEKLLNTLDEQLAAAEALTLAAELVGNTPAEASGTAVPPLVASFVRRAADGFRTGRDALKQAHVLAQEAAR